MPPNKAEAIPAIPKAKPKNNPEINPSLLGSNSWAYSNMAVSYTHLDVYKRQVQTLLGTEIDFPHIHGRYCKASTDRNKQ